MRKIKRYCCYFFQKLDVQKKNTWAFNHLKWVGKLGPKKTNIRILLEILYFIRFISVFNVIDLNIDK